MTNAFPSSDAERAAVEWFLETITRVDPPMNALLETALDHAHAYRTRLSTPVRIAFTGKSSADKSSLINLLVGEEVLPSGPASEGMPTTLVRHGHKDRTIASWWDRPGQPFEGRDLDAARALSPDFIVLEVDCEALEGLSLVDVVGFDDPESSKRAIFTLMRLADVMLWCSRADNPMLRAESDSWKLVPARLVRNSLLVLTHAEDVSEDAIEAAKQKLTSERLKTFRHVVPISTRVALMALQEPGDDFEDLWQVSGAAQLVDSVIASAVAVREAELERVRKGLEQVIAPAQAELDRMAGTDPVRAPAPETPVAPAPSGRIAPMIPAVTAPVAQPAPAPERPAPGAVLLADWAARIGQLAGLAQTAPEDVTGFVVAAQVEVDAFRETLADTPGLVAGAGELVDEFERANDLLILLQFETAATVGGDAARILWQLSDSTARALA